MKHASGRAGFTLLETILSLALTALVVGMLATMARQWLINWNLGADHIEQIEAVTLAENRLADDIGKAIAFPLHPQNPSPAFSGEEREIYFVREPTDIDGTQHLIAIRYTSDLDSGIVRSSAIYDATVPITALDYSARTTLLPPPYQLTFGYLSETGEASPDWQKRSMPSEVSVLIALRNAHSFAPRGISLLTPLAALCGHASSYKECKDAIESGKTGVGKSDQSSKIPGTIQDNTKALQP